MKAILEFKGQKRMVDITNGCIKRGFITVAICKPRPIITPEEGGGIPGPEDERVAFGTADYHYRFTTAEGIPVFRRSK